MHHEAQRAQHAPSQWAPPLLWAPVANLHVVSLLLLRRRLLVLVCRRGEFPPLARTCGCDRLPPLAGCTFPKPPAGLPLHACARASPPPPFWHAHMFTLAHRRTGRGGFFPCPALQPFPTRPAAATPRPLPTVHGGWRNPRVPAEERFCDHHGPGKEATLGYTAIAVAAPSLSLRPSLCCRREVQPRAFSTRDLFPDVRMVLHWLCL